MLQFSLAINFNELACCMLIILKSKTNILKGTTHITQKDIDRVRQDAFKSLDRQNTHRNSDTQNAFKSNDGHNSYKSSDRHDAYKSGDINKTMTATWHQDSRINVHSHDDQTVFLDQMELGR